VRGRAGRRGGGLRRRRLGVVGRLVRTGPAAPGAYFQYVNANGGVNGRKLKFISRDDGYNPTNTASERRWRRSSSPAPT
jgi:hypothetical protein